MRNNLPLRDRAAALFGSSDPSPADMTGIIFKPAMPPRRMRNVRTGQDVLLLGWWHDGMGRSIWASVVHGATFADPSDIQECATT